MTILSKALRGAVERDRRPKMKQCADNTKVGQKQTIAEAFHVSLTLNTGKGYWSAVHSD